MFNVVNLMSVYFVCGKSLFWSHLFSLVKRSISMDHPKMNKFCVSLVLFILPFIFPSADHADISENSCLYTCCCGNMKSLKKWTDLKPEYWV